MKPQTATRSIAAAFVSAVLSYGSPGASAEPAYLGQGAQQVSVVSPSGEPLCNSDAFAQIPNSLDYFIGRAKENSDGNPCSGTNWGLALFKMNWQSNTLRMVKFVFKPPESGDPYGINSAYDPYVTIWRDTYWVAFECVGSNGKRAWDLGTSSCVAPLNAVGGIENANLNVRRLSVVVSGTSSDPDSAYRYSASVPKLLVLNDRVYMYWSAIKIEKADRRWLGSTTRGVELTQDKTDSERIWAVRSVGEPLASYDPSRNVEVLGVNPGDPRANNLATIFSVLVSGPYVYATAGVGGEGCTKPSDPVPGCFRLGIFRASSPLGVHVFNEAAATPAVSNPEEYSRFFRQPDGRLFIMGLYTDPQAGANVSGPKLSKGIWRYPADLRGMNFVGAGER